MMLDKDANKVASKYRPGYVTETNEQLDLLKTKYKHLLKKLADIEMANDCKQYYTPIAREAGLLLQMINSIEKKINKK